ncbi:MAG TPA: hypothetical protein VHP37_22405 [Burkholderiales bacterium]|nr:hypothetical protein [Burkholderiales bacterium]
MKALEPELALMLGADVDAVAVLIYLMRAMMFHESCPFGAGCEGVS